VVWLEGKLRSAAAWLNYNFAGPRLAMPETYAALAAAIDPDPRARFSHDRMPAMSIPLDPLSRRLMLWALQRAKRLQAVNKLFGTALSRLQMDLLPGLRCAAHMALIAPWSPCTRADHVAAGRAFQRAWLMAERLGLRLQPEYTAVALSRKSHGGLPLTKVTAIQSQIERLVDEYGALLAPLPTERCLMLARLGDGPPAHARALRLTLGQLTVSSPTP
jgi:hypothetical protein